MSTDINQKERPELKSYFIAFSIPTQENFEYLIDAMIIQGEDPIAVVDDTPLMIKSSGASATRNEFLHLFKTDFNQGTPWILGENIAHEAFEIGTTGKTHFYIGRTDSKVGININTADSNATVKVPRGQLDVYYDDSGGTSVNPLIIAGDTNNYLSVGALSQNAKVVVGGHGMKPNDATAFFNDKAKLHVTLDTGNNKDADVAPLIVEDDNGDAYLSICSKNNNRHVGIGLAVSETIDERLTVNGNIKAVTGSKILCLKNSGDDNALVSEGTLSNLLKIISDGELGFWANSKGNVTANSHLLINTYGQVGIGFDTVPSGAKLAVNDSIYVGTGSTMTSNFKLEVIGNARINGDLHTTGDGVFNGGNIKGVSGTGGALNIYGADSDSNYITIRNGRLGVMNVDSPSEAIEVNGTVKAKAFRYNTGVDVVPRGVIVMWSGKNDNIPSGWALCDGTGSRPNLIRKFIMGGHKAEIGNEGGEEKVKLKEAEMPKHRHHGWGERYTDWQFGYTGSRNQMGSGKTDYDNYFYFGSYQGGDQPHNNLPPYYVLAYIIKL
ncbi:MAG: hypothetical protein GKR88_10925 [Flavobacteriaceae bacterium]|nr:MAG: hypothetical protein GKR88_10925 [Flavobacteriaceae bacterium]